MQLINNQYRVLDIVNEERAFSTYKVEDVFKVNKPKYLMMFEHQKETEAFIYYLMDNFYDYSNMFHPNIAQFYFFNKVNQIDNKPVSINKYYFTYDYFEGKLLFDYIHELSFDERLELVIQLCSAVKYLHLKGFLLCNININELYIVQQDGKPQLRITSIPFPQNIDTAYTIEKDNKLFKAPELYKENRFDILSDIYLLGIVLFYIMNDIKIEHANFREDLQQSKENLKGDFLKISDIVIRCTNLDKNMRYQDVCELVEDINVLFHKDYQIIVKSLLEKMPSYRAKLIPEQKQINKIVALASDYFIENGKIRAAKIGFAEGAAQDDFVKNLTIRASQEGFFSTVLNSLIEKQFAFEYITPFIKDLIKNCEKDLLAKYNEVISSISDEKQEPNENIESKLKLKYRLVNFILEAVAKTNYMLVADNYYLSDADSLDVMKMLLQNDNTSRLFIAFAADEFIANYSTKVGNLETLLEGEESSRIKVGNYNISETAEYLKSLLSTTSVPLDFTTYVFKQTDGAPTYIHDIVYMLFNNKRIYVDDCGIWNFDHVNFNSTDVLFNLDEITLSKISNFQQRYQKALMFASICEASISPEMLAVLMNTTPNDALEMLNYLSYMNILIRKVDDWGINYDFKSTSLKKTLYERIPAEDKLKYHLEMSVELEKNTDKTEYKNDRELVYQLIKSNRFERAIDLLIKDAEELVKSNLVNQGIQTLNHAYDLIDTNQEPSKKIKICLELGKLYMYISGFEQGLKFFDEAEKLVLEQKEIKILIDIYISKGVILHRLKRDTESLHYIRSVKRLLREVSYCEGFYEYILSLNDLMQDKRKYNAYIKILYSTLKNIDKSSSRLYYARLLVLYGIGLMMSRKLGGSIDILKDAASIFEELGEYRYLPQVYNAIGTCYIDLFNDYTKSKEFFDKGLSISLKINNQRYAHIIYNNIAEIYREQDEYGRALEYYKQSLEIVKITQLRYSELLVELNIALLRIAMEDYYNAFKGLQNVENGVKESKDIGDIVRYLYEFKAEYYYRLGYYEISKDYAQKSVDMCITWGISINMESILLRHLSEIKLTNHMDFREDLNLCKDIFGDNLYKLGRIACLQLAEIYTEEGNIPEAREFLQMGLRYADKIETDILKVQYKYLEALTGPEEEKQNKLTEAAAKMERLENLEIKWKIYKAIAQSCLRNGEYQEALKYFISALNMLRKLVHNVPDEYKTTFVLSHGRNTVKEGLKNISEIIMHTKKENEEEQRDSSKVTLQNLDKYFDYTDYIDIYREGEKEPGEAGRVDHGSYNKLLDKMREIISSFTDNNIENIKGVVSLCAEVSQAKNAFLATLDEEDNLNILSSYNRYLEIPFYKYVIEQAKQKKDSIIVTDVFDYNKSKGDLLIPKEITAVFCIPIMSSKEEEGLGLLKERRRQKQGNESSIIGYIYLDTDSIINNFTQECGQFCKILAKMAYILVDNYNLKIVSTVDKLTKLYTRKYFETALQNEIACAEKEGSEFSIIMIDIDKFKSVNDRFGHQKGDEILQGVSGIIMNSLRKEDIAARYGGEEIIILLPGAGEEEGLEVAEKLRKKIENARLLGLHNPLTISLGSAAYPKHSSWAKDLIEKADQALYHAKENGRNQSCLYKEDMSKTAKRIDKLAGIISGNLVEDQRKVETMLEVLELQRSTELKLEEKLFNFLGRIIEVSEAQIGIIFELGEAGEIKNKLARKKFISKAVEEEYYNEELVKHCMENETGEYRVDWNSYPGLDNVTGTPDWQSIMVVPMSIGGRLAGVLYLSVSIKTKEFDAGEYNYIKTLCDILVRIF